MKFKAGDSIDSGHCTALVHEFCRCKDSFEQFTFYAEQLIIAGRTKKRSYRAYNAYADFIHHLYEFIQGCHARDAGDTGITNKREKEKTATLVHYVMHHAQRIMNQYRDAIKRGTAPDWVNDIGFHEATVPENFAKDFRRYRNKVVGHVAQELSSQLSLSDFYHKYRKFLYYLYIDSIHMWGNYDEFQDLKEITDFTVMIEEQNQ